MKKVVAVTVSVSEEMAQWIQVCGEDFEAIVQQGRQRFAEDLLVLPEGLVKPRIEYCAGDPNAGDDMDMEYQTMTLVDICCWLEEHGYGGYVKGLKNEEFLVCGRMNQFRLSWNLKTILDKVAGQRGTTPVKLLTEILITGFRKRLAEDENEAIPDEPPMKYLDRY